MKKCRVEPLEAVNSIFNTFRTKLIDIICLTREQENLGFKYLNLSVGKLIEIENATFPQSKSDTGSLESSRRLSASNFGQVVK